MTDIQLIIATTAALRRMIEQHGITRTSELVGMKDDNLRRIMQGRGVRIGTISQLARALGILVPSQMLGLASSAGAMRDEIPSPPTA